MELIARYHETPVAKPINVPVVLGTSIGELIAQMDLPDWAKAQVIVMRGDEVLADDYLIQDGDDLKICMVQGKKIVSIVALIAIAVVAPQIAAGIGLTGLAAAGAAAAITMVGSLIVSALIPPTGMGGKDQPAANDTFFVTGASNQAKLYDNVPSIYGTHKIYPDLAAKVRSENVGTMSEIAMLLDLGIGDVEIEDINVADTPLASLGLQTLLHPNTKTPNLRWISNLASVQPFSIKVDMVGTTLTSATDATKIEVVLQFSRGLFTTSKKGDQISHSVPLTLEYRLVGATTWTRLPNVNAGGKAYYTGTSISGRSLEPFMLVAGAAGLPAGQYEVRVARGSYESTDAKTSDDIMIVQLKSYKDGDPLTLDRKHTLLEVYGMASEKLQGVVQAVNVIAHRKIRDITATGWDTVRRTSNPALIALDILTCEENPQPLPDKQIDFASWKRLRDICEGGKYTFNGILRESGTVAEAVAKVLTNARAQLNIQNNGKIGVLIDEAGRMPRQMITPANSWEFSGTRSFPVYPDALRVTYIEPKLGYQNNEVIVYDDGKDGTNSERFEDLNTVGITNRDEAWRWGRYMMAQAKMRNETFTVKMDVEHLAVLRGDIVTVQHDVPKFGGVAARVVSVAGTAVTLDTTVVASGPLGARIRQADGTISTRQVAGISGNVVTLDSAVAGLDYGDLIVIGELGKETQDYIVLSIEPDVNLAATLTLTKYVPGVYTADTGTAPPWDPGFGTDISTGTGGSNIVVGGLTSTYSLNYVDRQPLGQINLNWAATGNVASLAYYEVIVTKPDGTREVVAETSVPSYQMTVELLGNRDVWNKDYAFEIRPVNTLGAQGTSASTTAKLVPDNTPPAAVDGFGVNVTNNTSVDLFWRLSDEPDIDFYDLRYTPEVVNPQWSNGLHLANVDYRTDRTSVGARTGTYMIAAVDTSGNRSAPVMLRTAVETLPDLQIVKEIDDSTTGWLGTKTDMIVQPSGSLALATKGVGAASRGVYQFQNMLDLGSIDEVRVQAKLTATGTNTVTGLESDEWDAWVEVRTTDKMEVMADWKPLASIDPIAPHGVGWQPWRRFESADVTGRTFQFRLIVVSNNPDVNVYIHKGLVEVDVLERVVSFPDVQVTAAGTNITFDPAFRDIPSVAVTIDGSPVNLRALVTNKTVGGMTVQLINDAGVPQTGQVDVLVGGWGRRRAKPL
jgi:hypothetical protein